MTDENRELFRAHETREHSLHHHAAHALDWWSMVVVRATGLSKGDQDEVLDWYLEELHAHLVSLVDLTGAWEAADDLVTNGHEQLALFGIEEVSEGQASPSP